jgi:glucose-6-phosphate 1-dehydrogenase
MFASPECRPGPNRLTFRTKPQAEISLSVQAKVPGLKMISGPSELHLEHGRDPGHDPYERLIGDALRGDPALFARQDGVMEAWRIVEDVLTDHSPVIGYERGSWGPAAAASLLGHDWDWIAR